MKKLVLVDPWGFPVRDPSGESARRIPLWIRALVRVASAFNPLSVVRAAGPLGNFYLALNPSKISCPQLSALASKFTRSIPV